MKTGLIYVGCAVAAVFSGVMIFLEPYLIHTFKVFARRKLSSIRPHSSWWTVRLLDDPPLKQRSPVSIADMPGEPGEWVRGYYYIEEHDATNLHHDFSIVVKKKVYRVARAATPGTVQKKGFLGVFPHIGEKTGWVRQPEHYVNEVPNPPVIHEGYGKGTTKVLKQGNCFVMKSVNNNMHVIFEDVDGVYTFVETKGNQVLMMRKHYDGSWFGKHRMADSNEFDRYADDPNYTFFTKYDGAAIEWRIVKGSDGKKYLHVHSYRQNMRIYKETGIVTQIDHTFRLGITDRPLPDDMPLAAGRGELWIDGPDGRIKVARLMNSLHYNARSLGYKPQLYLHDVIEYDGKIVENLPFAEKMEIIKEIRRKDHRFSIPVNATKPEHKRGMWDFWKGSRDLHPVDGVVAWEMEKPNAKPIKIKFTHEKENWHSATIVDITPQQGEHSDKYAYPILQNEQGTRFQVSGKGLSNERKADLKSHPEKYIGMEVRYSADSHFDKTTGKPFQPTLKEWCAI